MAMSENVVRAESPRSLPVVREDDGARILERFLRGVERRALRMAEYATGQRDEAFDLVQEAMLGFVRRYASRPECEWPPLFYRVLDSRLTDWHRRRRVRDRWRAIWCSNNDEDESGPIARVADPHEPGPFVRVVGAETIGALDAALAALPLRQRQAFLLRVWEGLDVATTAVAMRCSEGSVKTHLFRAQVALRRALEEHR